MWGLEGVERGGGAGERNKRGADRRKSGDDERGGRKGVGEAKRENGDFLEARGERSEGERRKKGVVGGG